MKPGFLSNINLLRIILNNSQHGNLPKSEKYMIALKELRRRKNIIANNKLKAAVQQVIDDLNRKNMLLHKLSLPAKKPFSSKAPRHRNIPNALPVNMKQFVNANEYNRFINSIKNNITLYRKPNGTYINKNNNPKVVNRTKDGFIINGKLHRMTKSANFNYSNPAYKNMLRRLNLPSNSPPIKMFIFKKI